MLSKEKPWPISIDCSGKISDWCIIEGFDELGIPKFCKVEHFYIQPNDIQNILEQKQEKYILVTDENVNEFETQIVEQNCDSKIEFLYSIPVCLFFIFALCVNFCFIGRRICIYCVQN